MSDPRRLLRALVLAVAGFAPPSGARAQATPYVPAPDPAYENLDALLTAGLVRGLILGQRPYSRLAFARAALDARARLDAGREGSFAKPRVLEALARLESRFADEIESACPAGAESCPDPQSYGSLRRAELSATWADSPPRTVPTSYTERSHIDADVDPLLQRDHGRVLVDGWTAAVETQWDGAIGRRLALQVQPRVWLAEDPAGGAEADVTLVTGYARALLGNLSVVVGRDQVSHGHARAYRPVFSDNARGFDMIRLSMERPAHLPWIFRYLGPVGFTGMVADMGRDQDIPGSKLFVFEGAMRPHRNLEIGGAVLNHQLGEGAPEATVGQRIRDILLIVHRRGFFSIFPPVGAEFSDKVVAADVRLTLPAQGLDVYAEVTTTDDHGFFKRPHEPFWTEAAWTWGARLSGLGDEGRVDLWTELGRNGVRIYTHHQFTSGLTLDRRIIGSPLGPLGTGIQGGLDWTGTKDRVSLGAAWERYSSDRYSDDPDTSGLDWVKVADNPDEIRVRTTLAWTREAARPGLRMTVRLGYEHVTRFDFTDRNRSNFLAQVGLEYVW